MPNTANAVWTGAIREGAGKVRLGNGAFEGDYSFKSRFEDGEGTNPEELIAAAHAACISMATTSELNQAGIESQSVETDATVTLKMVDGTPTIARILASDRERPGSRRGRRARGRRACQEGLPGVAGAGRGRDDRARPHDQRLTGSYRVPPPARRARRHGRRAAVAVGSPAK